jgi:aspartyl-tRNA(Asn)/glutamyl-tRNA(Gln) amidotransferase subunit A
LEIFRSFKSLSNALKKSEVSCVDVTSSYLQRIKSSTDLNIFIETFDEEALIRAAQIDKKISKGQSLPI